MNKREYGEIHEKIVNSLIEKVVRDSTGESEEELERYFGFAPNSRFWLGILGPKPSPEEMEKSKPSFMPCSQGFSFKVADLPLVLELKCSFAIWIPIHPTFEEQVKHSSNIDGGGYDLVQVRMKVPIPQVSLNTTIESPGKYQLGREQFSRTIKSKFSDLPPGTTVYRPKAPNYRSLEDEDLVDKKSWKTWCENNLLESELPTWEAEFSIDVSRTEQTGYEVNVLLTNSTPRRNKQTISDIGKEFPSWVNDLNLYEVQVSATLSKPVKPYILEQIPESFRYDRTVAALGTNCAAKVEENEIKSSSAPLAETNRVYPRREYKGETIDTRFSNLKNNPMPLVHELIEMAKDWTDENWSKEHLEELAKEKKWDEAMLEEAIEEKDLAYDELEWLTQGIKVLEEDEDLLQAFSMMNETMELIADNKEYDSWFPFQLAFIIGSLPGVVDPENHKTVDILWFKTGGGKTEAYLGLNLVHLFYERLNGRNGGSQTWARFPLRLLSLQQSQRFAESVINAEVVRRRYESRFSGDPFSIGFFVGSSITPNKVYLPDSKFYNGWNPRDPETVESCRVLDECPVCHSDEKPVVRFDEEHHTLVHECKNEDCEMYGEWLPIFVVDDDIYRRAPTVIVGTVDKLAQIGQNKGFRILMGESDTYCPKHGYSHLPNSCSRYWDCEEELRPVGDGFKGINFEIQDELHLIRESLGSLDANYETLFQKINKLIADETIRIVGATATIEGYKQQVKHLYQREARRFPLPGPSKEESFWAIEDQDDKLRNYVGILPRDTTMLNASFKIVNSYWNFIDEGLEDAVDFTHKLGLDESYSDEVKKVLRSMYETLVAYSLRKQDLERFAKDLEDSPKVCPDERNYDRITGDVKNISPILNKLQNPPEEQEKRIRVLGATSAISHGVDINRLNLMNVMGMPTTTGEFIQSTSRVGREVPAVVFSLINPSRERDVSHYRYFTKYAEYLDMLVEPVPVTRESLPILKRVLSGGIAALILQYYEPKWLEQTGERLWKESQISEAIKDGLIKDDFLVKTLMEAFCIKKDEPRFSRHVREIEHYVEEEFMTDFQVSGGSNRGLLDALEPPVPRSLRDLEPTISIYGER